MSRNSRKKIVKRKKILHSRNGNKRYAEKKEGKAYVVRGRFGKQIKNK